MLGGRAILAVLVGVITLTSTAVGSAGAEPTPGAIGIRLVDAPTTGRDDPRAQTYIVDHLAPGTTISRRIEVSNGTDSAADISLYPSPAQIVDGTFIGADAGATGDLTSWTTIDLPAVTLAPGATSVPTVSIAVPADASPGERYGVVWAEVQSGVDAGGVVQKSRVGVRIYLSVGGGNAPAAAFVIDELTAGRSSAGEPTIVASVRNTGGRAIDISGTLSLSSGPGGLSAGPFPVTLGSTLAPGQTEPVSVTLDTQLPDGPWTAELALNSGNVTSSARAEVTFPVVGSAAPVPVSAPTGLPGWLIPTAITVFVLAVLMVLFVVRRRRPPPGDSAPRRTPADALRQSS